MNARPHGLDQDTVTGFLDEAGKHVATLNERLLAAEQGRSGSEDIAEMFRAAHSLKGAAGFLKLTDICNVTHRMESVLDQVRHGKLAFSGQVIDALFPSFDVVAALLANIAAGTEAPVDTAPAMALLDAILAGNKAAATAAAAAAPAPAPVVAAPIAVPADPAEDHLGPLPGWLRGRLDEEDVCEAMFAGAADQQVVALRFTADDLIAFPAGAAAALTAVQSAGHVRRLFHLLGGPQDLDAPVGDYALAIGLLVFVAGDPQQVLPALAVPLGEAWVLKSGTAAPPCQRIGRDPATLLRRHDRLVVKAEAVTNLPLWLSTSREHLSELDAALLDLERNPDEPAHLDAVFRQLHSLKGASASIGLDEMARLAHQGEHLLAALREGRLRLDAQGISALFATKDALQACADRVERGDQSAPDVAALDATIGARLAALGAAVTALPAWIPGETELAAAHAAAQGRPLWKVRLLLTAQSPLADLRLGMILGNLAKLGAVCFARPTLAELERGLPEPPPLLVLLASTAARAELAAALACDQVRDWALDALPAPAAIVSAAPAAPVAIAGASAAVAAAPAVAGPAKAAPAAAPAAPAAAVMDTVRVETARLDHLLNTTGELVITKARLTQQIDSMVRLLDGVDARMLEHLVARQGGGAPTARLSSGIAALRRAQDEVRRTRDTTLELHRHISAMQLSVMQARMVPIGPLFQRFHRLVRDLCKENNRDARLVTAGENTELDKKLIDEIGDPLTHLIRNGMDHGLETPDDRVKAGKPRQGTVRLEAFHQGGMICIRVGDDGRGLDVERIRAKAIERGLVTAEAAARLSPEETFQFIFLPGFSTAAQVTNISGRGVGMDIVKNKVTALKGKIDIASTPGQGASFTIALPLTLAMIDSLLVRIGEARFAFPLDCVREIVELRQEDVRSVEGKGRVIFLRDQVISLLDLHQVIGISPLAAPGGTVRAVVTKGAGETLAIAVDQVIGDEEIVVKPLGQEFAHVRGLSGATVLGDGGVALILDIHGIHDLSRTRRQAGGQAGQAGAAGAPNAARRPRPAAATPTTSMEGH